ncbi:MAG TPA: NYN domain-containing protein [Candidatus Deferrimicrobium sp.]|nr:NYN domain-containing protein [Candidatus Deferrimicrobium sp.]
MSKNVAVFVDVANIFYAAKAAGVDIDYVTLLKSATAGRDFVRAYAYTGLDPENENQKQFHGFLARSGYKVVSKDIRKYGDGRVKANLDIELVVDLMRMAEKLDVAVIISGDGDFAPAIYAVQQQGVRVEVISFRGNTSSDLIDAADIFIDISSVAKVEKGARSGRRVAAEGDLSMTEVPDKESGVTPRRRRRESDEKPDRTVRPSRRRGSQIAVPSEAEAAVPDVARPAAALVALPGERLSRGPVQVVAPVEVDVEVDVAEIPGETQPEEGHRRRRRRGGRGRGRGGRGAEVGQVGEAEEAGDTSPDESEADIPEFADEVLPLPQHSGFGSVWDSQIGVAPERRSGPAPAPRGADPVDDLEVEGEPEVPEYLLAERRQQDRNRGGRGGRSGGYRSAIDRERYGAGPRPGYQRGPARPGRSARPMSGGRASAQAMEPIEQTPGGDPWSEVPPDVQEMLRAELARRQAASGQAAGGRQSGGQRTSSAPAKVATTDATPVEAPAPVEAATPKRTTRKRTTKPAEASEA